MVLPSAKEVISFDSEVSVVEHHEVKTTGVELVVFNSRFRDLDSYKSLAL